jgi:D-alanine-D-alanine ligase
MNLPVLICHSNIPDDAPPDELDVMDQVEWFKSGLQFLNLDFTVLPFTLDLPSAISNGDIEKPGLVINLVETINGDGRMIHLAPSLFEHYHIPFTGCSSEAIYVTSNKILAKKIMKVNGISTPSWIEAGLNYNTINGNCEKYIIKSLWEHASAGMDEHNMKLPGDYKTLQDELQRKSEGGAEFFAEQYIHGREFNISLLETPSGPRAFTPSEILFIGYPDDKPRVVGYRAKWDKDSFEYRNTVRSFDMEQSDAALFNNLMEISYKLWRIFRLRGYARVDFRVDEKGVPWVLEINANPCISGDSGYVAAAEKTGIMHHEIVKNLISSAG